MDGRRLVWLYLAILPLLLVALLSPGRAHAAGTVAATPGGETSYRFGNTSGQWVTYTGGDPVAHCTTYAALYGYPGELSNGNMCYLTYGGGNYGTGFAVLTTPGAATCPDNSTVSSADSAVCNCAVGYQPNTAGNLCVLPPSACAAKLGVALTGEITIPTAGQIVPASACVGGCAYAKTFESGGVWGKLGGAWTYAGKGADYVGNGAPCSPAPTGTATPTDPPAEPLPNPPPKGMCPGTVNGLSVPVPCDTTASNNPGPTGSGTGAGGLSPPPPGASGGAAGPGAVGSPGAGSFSPAPAASAPPGAKAGDKASNGTCTGDKCAQTECIVVLKADLSMQKECGTTYEDKGTYCKNKPGDPNCVDVKNTFAGSCDAPVRCTGDAVQCQVARQQLADSCDARKVSEETGAIYTGLKGTGVSITGLDSSFNIGNMLPAGPSNTCALTDTTIALYDQFSVSLPLGSLLCDKLGVIRGVIAAFGFVMWSIIVFGLRGN